MCPGSVCARWMADSKYGNNESTMPIVALIESNLWWGQYHGVEWPLHHWHHWPPSKAPYCVQLIKLKMTNVLFLITDNEEP